MIGLLIYTVYQFHSVKLLIHHKLGTDKDFTNLTVLSSVFLLHILCFLLYKKIKFIPLFLSLTVSIGALAFTLITEPPSVSMSDERKTMEEISDQVGMGDWDDYDTMVESIKEQFQDFIYSHCGFGVWWDIQI